MTRLIRWALVLVVVTTGLLVGTAAVGATAEGMSLVRLVHASPNGPAVDIYVDGQRATQALKFGDITPYAVVPAGTHRIQVLSASAGPTSTALIDTQATLQPDTAYSILAADKATNMSMLVLTDTLTIEPGNKAFVRLVHLSPDAPPVADVAVTGGPVVASGLAFKGTTDYLPVDPGTYRFDVQPSGSGLTLATTDPITLVQGQIYSVFVIGQLADNTFRAVIAPDNARSGGIGGVPSTGGGGLATQPVGQFDPASGFGLALGLCSVLLAGVWLRRRRAA